MTVSSSVGGFVHTTGLNGKPESKVRTASAQCQTMLCCSVALRWTVCHNIAMLTINILISSATRRRSLLVAFFTLILGVACARAQTKEGNGFKAYDTAAANVVPAKPPVFGEVLLGGHGGTDLTLPFFCGHSGGGNIVVLSAYDEADYNPDFHSACPANSVTTISITSAEGARDPYVAATIHDAHAIFFAGGDQSKYVKFWSASPVQAEINRAAARGVPIGGISAGLAVQGQFAFSAMLDTVTSPEALANPYDPKVTLERNFLDFPSMKGIITDSHFSQRERMGRLVTFLARIVQDGWASEVHGIGIDETTAVLLERGNATVSGKGAAYFFTLRSPPEKCLPGHPLTVRGIAVYRLPAGVDSHFDFTSWKGTGGSPFSVDVIDGQMIRSDQPTQGQ
jgi:cyanophycinase